jgi:hypothetical protein
MLISSTGMWNPPTSSLAKEKTKPLSTRSTLVWQKGSSTQLLRSTSSRRQRSHLLEQQGTQVWTRINLNSLGEMTLNPLALFLCIFLKANFLGWVSKISSRGKISRKWSTRWKKKWQSKKSAKASLKPLLLIWPPVERLISTRSQIMIIWGVSFTTY